jgi:hypothetical protein
MIGGGQELPIHQCAEVQAAATWIQRHSSAFTYNNGKYGL